MQLHRDVACSRLRDSGEKGEEKTRTKKRAGAEERQGSEGQRENKDEKTRGGWGETRLRRAKRKRGRKNARGLGRDKAALL